MNIPICYVSPLTDYSGYGEAGRHDVLALLSAGFDVSTVVPRYCLELSDFGELTPIFEKLQGKDNGYDIKILHTTPNTFRTFFEPNKYIIGRVFWETDRLPDDFIRGLEYVNEVWTGSAFNKQAIINAGFTKPIYIIPEAIQPIKKDIEPYKTMFDDQKTFTFYSMFEWTERKNPRALLESYWTEFTEKDNVALVIKTYIDNFLPEKKQEILSYIKRVKKRLNLPYYAPVYIFNGLMNRFQIYRFHSTFDCFISTHRGEGWGIPQMEALAIGKPIISTNCGGIHEYLKHEENAFLLPYTLTSVNNTRSPQWYTPAQQWAEVDIIATRRAMRTVYEDKNICETVGSAGKEACKQFGVEAVGAKMFERLTAITKKI